MRFFESLVALLLPRQPGSYCLVPRSSSYLACPFPSRKRLDQPVAAAASIRQRPSFSNRSDPTRSARFCSSPSFDPENSFLYQRRRTKPQNPRSPAAEAHSLYVRPHKRRKIVGWSTTSSRSCRSSRRSCSKTSACRTLLINLRGRNCF